MLTADDLARFDPTTKRNIEQWLHGTYDDASKAAIYRLMQEAPDKLTDAFYTSLSFGTGGIRGVMGVGTNRMNRYTVRAATQGLASYLLKQKHEGSCSVFISYDSRHHSRDFAEEAARVLAANGVTAYLTRELRPTPLVSFGCRHLGCCAAIMITASHNPPEYNGYKVYWNDGAQVVPPHDQGIIAEVNAVADPAGVPTAELTDPLIKVVGEDLDTAYLDAMATLQHHPSDNAAHGRELSVAFSNLHGTGITLLPQALDRWGFSTLHIVEEQRAPDGNFPTAEKPNPEEREALKLGIETMEKEGCDILLATDPDADRVGVAVRQDGDVVLLSGNQIACLCLHHICEALSAQKRLPENAAFIKTIVTSELFTAIAKAHGRPCFDVLTGFKFIAQLIREWEDSKEHQYLFGGEESYGYLLGTSCRDKDAISACALICETALVAKRRGKSLVDLLEELYHKYGVFREMLVSVHFGESKTGKEQMDAAMASLRNTPPAEFNGTPVTAVEDYQSSTKVSADGSSEPITLPKSNVLLYWLADGTKLVVRPSGTEPKIKLYCSTTEAPTDPLSQAISRCDRRGSSYLEAVEMLLKS